MSYVDFTGCIISPFGGCFLVPADNGIEALSIFHYFITRFLRFTLVTTQRVITPWTSPILDAQPRDSDKLFHIIGNQYEIFRPSMSGDQ